MIGQEEMKITKTYIKNTSASADPLFKKNVATPS
jgi:hypothetical protein